MATNTRTENLKLTIDGEDVVDSYSDLQRANRQLVKELKSTVRGTDEYVRKSQQLNQVRKRLEDVKGDIKGIGSEWKKQQSMWSQAKSVFAGAFAAFTVAGAITQIQQLGTQVVRFVRDLTKQREEIRKLTGAVGENLDKTSAKISAIADTYQQDFSQVLGAANSFAQQMNISITDALDLITEGFNQGADQGGEFLSILKEYPAQFQAAGLSADQAIALITQQVQQGVFSDKGVDVIKEGTLRLREMTIATRDALEAIGISSDQLEADLRSNTITYFEAIQMVSDKLAELPPQSVEVGTALADIFGGAGEDAGLSYIQTLGGIETQLSAVETQTSKLAEANERLNLAYQKLADDGGLINKLEVGFKNFTAFLLENSDTLLAGLSAPLSIASRFFGNEEAPQTNAPFGPNPLDPNAGLNLPGANQSTNKSTTSSTDQKDKKHLIGGILLDNPEFMALMEQSAEDRQILAAAAEAGFSAIADVTESEIEKIMRENDALAENISRNDQRIMDSNEQVNQSIMQRILMHRAETEESVRAGMAAAAYSDSIEESGKALINSIRDQIQAHISQSVAQVVGEALTKVPFPANIILGATAGFAVTKLFNTLIPRFSTGSSGSTSAAVSGARQTNISPNFRQDTYTANNAGAFGQDRRFNPNINVSPNVRAEFDTDMLTDSIGRGISPVLQNMKIKAVFGRYDFSDAREDYDEFQKQQGRGAI